MAIRRNKCLLCGSMLVGVVDGPLRGIQKHPKSATCEVLFTDEWGIALDEHELPVSHAEVDDDGIINISSYPTVDVVLEALFKARKLPRLGGASSGKGWSSFSLFQRCPYAWKRRYLDNASSGLFVEPPGMAIGSIIHALLALYYENMLASSKYRGFMPEMLYREMVTKANPEFVTEAWRVFCAYALYYQEEEIMPLAIEYDLKDPRTLESCRFDLIAFFPKAHGDRPAGTHVVEHKSTARFDYDTLTAWSDDGEVLGQIALWDQLHLDKRFGALRGVIVNLLGKQKEPKFHRTIVAPSSYQIEQHLDDLKKWEGLIQLSRGTGIFPRARGNCINKFGRCQHWDHCAGVDV